MRIILSKVSKLLSGTPCMTMHVLCKTVSAYVFATLTNNKDCQHIINPNTQHSSDGRRSSPNYTLKRQCVCVCSQPSAELQSEPSHWDQFRNCNITAASLPPFHLFWTVWLQVGHTEEGGRAADLGESSALWVVHCRWRECFGEGCSKAFIWVQWSCC